jgi:hypothetical protein
MTLYDILSMADPPQLYRLVRRRGGEHIRGHLATGGKVSSMPPCLFFMENHE